MLEEKRVLVTGAGKGIGRAIALACAGEGATVGVNYRSSREGAEEVAALIAGEHGEGRALLLPFDVTDSAAVQKGVASFVEQAGSIDGLVNNAGMALPGLLATQPEENIDELLRVNLLGPILCARAALPFMLPQRGGVVLNVGSVTAARPSAGQAAYAAAKGGIESFTRALAVEYGRKGLRANCLRVGPVDTAMMEGVQALAGDEIRKRIPAGRLATADEVAGLAAFLLSDRAAFVTGAVVPIDGGFSLQ